MTAAVAEVNGESGSSAETSNTYLIRPGVDGKFRPVIVQDVIHRILAESLANKKYVADETTELCRQLADQIKNGVKQIGYDRYKYTVQVVIGEHRGQGVKMSCRTYWDSDTDGYVQDTFINETMFCVAAVYGVFYY